MIICTWAAVLATEVRLEWVAAWLAVTLAAGLGRGAFEERLRRRGARKGRAWIAVATLSGVTWAAAPLLSWHAGTAHGEMIAIGLVCAGFMLVFTQMRSAPREALIVSSPYSAAVAYMLASLWGTPGFWSLLALVPAVALSLLIKLVVTQIRDREIRLANGRQALLIRELETARDQADAASTAKSNFLAVMSHELRTPMNGVLGAAQLLETGPLAPRQKEFVDIIRQSGESLLALLNDILDLTKIEAGRMELTLADITLADLHRQLVGPFHAQAEAKGLEFVAPDPAGAPYLIRTDPLRLTQAVQNFLGNAVKFTTTGAVRLSVSTERLEDKGMARLTVAVEDDGIGIAAEDLPRLFEPFTQVDASSTRRFEGTGLGLSIAKRVARLLGGDVAVASTPGSGSRFSITIDVEVLAWSAPRAAAKTDQTVGLVSSASSLRILVVEDHPVNRAILEAFLRPLGHEVTTAADGQEAVALAADQAFDLIIMDVNMPVMDGLLATGHIRENAGPNRDTAIVILSASARGEDHQRGLEAGGDAYLDKPVDFAALMEVLALAGGGRRAFQEAAAAAGHDSLSDVA